MTVPADPRDEQSEDRSVRSTEPRKPSERSSRSSAGELSDPVREVLDAFPDGFRKDSALAALDALLSRVDKLEQKVKGFIEAGHGIDHSLFEMVCEERDELAAERGRYVEACDREREARESAERRAKDFKTKYEVIAQSFESAEAALRAAQTRADELENALAWGETFLARHDAFLQQQTPEIAHAMRDAADGFRAALAASPQAGDPPCPYCGMTARVEPSRKQPGRFMCHGCAAYFDAPQAGEHQTQETAT